MTNIISLSFPLSSFLSGSKTNAWRIGNGFLIEQTDSPSVAILRNKGNKSMTVIAEATKPTKAVHAGLRNGRRIRDLNSATLFTNPCRFFTVPGDAITLTSFKGTAGVTNVLISFDESIYKPSSSSFNELALSPQVLDSRNPTVKFNQNGLVMESGFSLLNNMAQYGILHSGYSGGKAVSLVIKSLFTNKDNEAVNFEILQIRNRTKTLITKGSISTIFYLQRDDYLSVNLGSPALPLVIYDGVMSLQVSNYYRPLGTNIPTTNNKITIKKPLTTNSIGYEMTDLFNNFGSTSLRYEFASNPFNSAFYSPDNPQLLVIQGRYRDTTYDVVIQATDALGAVATVTFAIRELAAPVTPKDNASIVLTDKTEAFNLDVFFNNFTNGDLAFKLQSNPKQNAKMEKSILSISGYNRDITYTLTVQATDVNYNTAVSVISVTELAPPVTSNFDIFYVLPELTTNTVSLSLKKFFNNFTKAPLKITILQDPQRSVHLDQLFYEVRIKGENRDMEYDIVLQAKDINNYTADVSLRVTEFPPYIPLQVIKAFDPISLDINNVQYDLSDYFDGTKLKFTYQVFATNPYLLLDISINNNKFLSITGALRDTEYTIEVFATDIFKNKITSTLHIQEKNPVKVTQQLGYIDLIKNAIYNLSDFFTGAELSYEIVDNPYQNVLLLLSESNNPIMHISGSFKGLPYDVTVKALDIAGNFVLNTLRVSEPYPVRIMKSFQDVTLSVYKDTYRLSDYFDGTEVDFLVQSSVKHEGITYDANTNILTIIPNLRGLDYTLHIIATDVGGNAQEGLFKVTERGPIRIKRELGSLESLTTYVEFKLSDFFEGAEVRYEITKNPYKNAQLLNDNLMRITGALRDDTYDVTVTAMDIRANQIDSTIRVSEPYPIRALKPFDEIRSLAYKDTKTYVLSEYFDGTSLTYDVKCSLGKDVFDFDDGIVKVTGDLRGTRFSIVVVATDIGGNVQSGSIVINERGPVRSIKPFEPLDLRSTTIQQHQYLLSDYFDGIDMFFEITNDPPIGSAFISENQEYLCVVGSLRGTTYDIVVRATDVGKNSQPNVLRVLEGHPVRIVQTFDDNITLINTNTNYVLEEYFSGLGLAYDATIVVDGVSSKSFEAVLLDHLNGVLTITPNLRGISYEIAITATDIGGFEETIAFVVTEKGRVTKIKTFDPIITLSIYDQKYVLSDYFTGTDVSYSINTLGIQKDGVVGFDEVDGIMTLFPRLRGTTYIVEITATDLGGFKAYDSTTIVERARVSKTKDFTTNVELTIYKHQYVLSEYFTGVDLTYRVETVGIDNEDDGVIDLDEERGILSITPDLRGTSYIVNVTARDIGGYEEVGHVRVTESARVSTTTKVFERVTLTIIKQEYVLSEYFVGIGVTYDISTVGLERWDDDEVVGFTNGVLSITPLLRGITYSVNIVASDVGGYRTNESVIMVTEEAKVSKIKGFGPVTLTIYKQEYTLTEFFTGVDLVYYVDTIGPINKGEVVDVQNNGILSIAPQLRGLSYDVIVTAVDVGGFIASDTIKVEERARISKIKSFESPTTTLAVDKLEYMLSDYFAGTDIKYEITTVGINKEDVIDFTNGIMSITPRLRGSTYTVNILATDVGGFKESGVIMVIESARVSKTSKRFEPVTLSIYPNEYVLSEYFSGVEIKYTWSIVSDVIGIAESTDIVAITDNDVLHITPQLRGVDYTVSILATDIGGNSASGDLFVAEIGPVSKKKDFDPINLTYVDKIYILSDYFDGFGLTYDVETTGISKNGVVSIDNSLGILTIKPQMRGTNYVVNVSVADVRGNPASSDITVTETAKVRAVQELGSLTLGTYESGSAVLTKEYTLSEYFDGDIRRYIVSVTNSNVSIEPVQNGILRLRGTLIGDTYYITVRAIDVASFEASSVLTVTEPPRVRTLKDFEATSLTDNTKRFVLSEYFVDGVNLTYTVVCALFPAAATIINDEFVEIRGDLRGETYIVSVTATDVSGHPVTNNIQVTEQKAIIKLKELGSVEITDDTVTYNLFEYFVHYNSTETLTFIDTDPYKNVTIVDGVLTLIGAGISTRTYYIVVTARDSLGRTEISTLSVTEKRTVRDGFVMSLQPIDYTAQLYMGSYNNTFCPISNMLLSSTNYIHAAYMLRWYNNTKTRLGYNLFDKSSITTSVSICDYKSIQSSTYYSFLKTFIPLTCFNNDGTFKWNVTLFPEPSPSNHEVMAISESPTHDLVVYSISLYCKSANLTLPNSTSLFSTKNALNDTSIPYNNTGYSSNPVIIGLSRNTGDVRFITRFSSLTTGPTRIKQLYVQPSKIFTSLIGAVCLYVGSNTALTTSTVPIYTGFNTINVTTIPSASYVLDNGGNSSVLLFKLDADGAIDQTISSHLKGSFDLYSLKVSDDGSIFIAVECTASNMIRFKHYTGASYTSIRTVGATKSTYIFKFDSNLQYVWNTEITCYNSASVQTLMKHVTFDVTNDIIAIACDGSGSTRMVVKNSSNISTTLNYSTANYTASGAVYLMVLNATTGNILRHSTIGTDYSTVAITHFVQSIAITENEEFIIHVNYNLPSLASAHNYTYFAMNSSGIKTTIENMSSAVLNFLQGSGSGCPTFDNAFIVYFGASANFKWATSFVQYSEPKTNDTSFGFGNVAYNRATKQILYGSILVASGDQNTDFFYRDIVNCTYVPVLKNAGGQSGTVPTGACFGMVAIKTDGAYVTSSSNLVTNSTFGTPLAASSTGWTSDTGFGTVVYGNTRPAVWVWKGISQLGFSGPSNQAVRQNITITSPSASWNFSYGVWSNYLTGTYSACVNFYNASDTLLFTLGQSSTTTVILVYARYFTFTTTNSTLLNATRAEIVLKGQAYNGTLGNLGPGFTGITLAN